MPWAAILTISFSMANQTNTAEQQLSFPKKVWIAASIVALIVVVLLLAKAVFNVLLLLFAAILIAVFFRGFGGLIQRTFKWKPGLSLIVGILVTVLFVGGLFSLIGVTVQSQIAEFSKELPQTIQTAKGQLTKTEMGRQLVTKLTSAKTREQLGGLAATFFGSTFGLLGDIYIVVFLGIFFTADPKTYIGGIVQLVPPPSRPKAEALMEKLGSNLRKWLKGQLFAMLVIFVLTAIGLVIIGVPIWLTLALMAGLLNFIPNFGPLIAMVPAVLIGFLQGPQTAIIVAILYIVIQVLESNFITPQVQKKLVDIPPALGIIAQLLIGVFSGGWGLLLATPLILVIMTIVQELYVKPMDEAEKVN